MAALRIVLADDNRGMLQELAAELGEEFEIVGIAENGQEAIDTVQRTDPDILVLDISMPILNGLQVASRLHESRCRAKIVFLTIHEQSSYISAAFSSGGSAYVAKRHFASDLAPAIRAAFEGQRFISPSLRG